MRQRCCVPGCNYGWGTNNEAPSKHMFSCSLDSPLRASWEAAVRPQCDGTFPKTIWCCEDHFQPSDILPVYTPGTPFQTKVNPPELRPGAVPSVFSGIPSQAKRPKQTKVFLAVTQPVQPSTSHNVQKKDVSVSRIPERRVIPRRRREQRTCDAIYCKDCREFSEEACWFHVSHIENTPVVPLALASLPDCLMICENSHEKGVFSKNPIYPQTLFGPMVGALCSSTAYSPFGCRAEDRSGIKRFHLDSDSCCNWLRYVRFAKNKLEQNLMACLHDGEVYFVATKEIQACEELKVGYSRRYEEMLKECPEPMQQYPEPVEPVGLPADWEPEAYPVEIVEPTEVQSDLVEHQLVEGTGPVVRRSKRKRHQTRFYGAEESDADDSDLDHESIYRRFVNPGPPLPTDEDQDPPPVEDFSVEALSALISPDLVQPNAPNADATVRAKQARNREKRSKAMRKNPALIIKFPCTECFVHFPSEESLVIHSLWHDGKEMNVQECPECGLFSDEFNWLAMHVNLHSTRYEPRERCRFCYLSISSTRMDQHLQNSHPLKIAVLDSNETATSAEKVLICDECRMYFPSEHLLTLHSRQHSGLIESMEQECPECNIVIEDAAEWMQHINEHGTKDVPMEKCQYCACTTIEHGNMESHVRRAHPNHYGDQREIFPCDVCGQEMASAHSLRMHRISKHGTPQCVICAKIEESWRTLSQHILMHKEEDGFHCPQCTSIFGTYHRLRTHWGDLHVLKNVRSCELCNRIFRNQRKLDRHMRTHSDVHEFSCERCGKGFHTRGNLKAHVKSMHKEAVPAS